MPRTHRGPGVETRDRSGLADRFRRWGYLAADLDPLGRLPPVLHPDLQAAPTAKGSAGEAGRWRGLYCGPIGVEFMHLTHPERVRFIAQAMESEAGTPDRRRILERLASAEMFERFLHSRYVGTKRYSLEGAAALIPLLDAILEGAAARRGRIVLIGMSHRGRLNVMTQLVGVPPSSLFAEFEDIAPESVMGSGDLRYHVGATGTYRTAAGAELHIHLVSNASHLEAVDPVMTGRARARQERLAAGPPLAEARAGAGP